MNNFCTDVDYVSMNKAGEQLCGDHVEIVEQGENSLVIVLADGLGSGVKASILSTLTSKIISTLMANSLTIEDCVATIVDTLPVCEERKIAYSTFTIMRIIGYREAEIIQYDNPHVVLLREGKNIEYPEIIEKIAGKIIYKTKIKLCEGDLFMLMSDGAVHAGAKQTLNYGWQRQDIINFMETIYTPEHTAKNLSTILVNECCSLYGGQPGDDITVCTVKIRQRSPVHLLIGPPAHPDDVAKMMSLFFSKVGKHIVCGGTTSTLAAEYLKQPLITSYSSANSAIPPIAKIAGVDLVTEGVITLNKVLEYAKNYLAANDRYTDWSYQKDGASRLARLLFEEATDINFYVGKAVNPAHQNSDSSLSFSFKMHLIDELAECLKKMGKKIKVSYF